MLFGYVLGLWLIPQKMKEDRQDTFRILASEYNLENSTKLSNLQLKKGTLVARAITGTFKNKEIYIIDCFEPNFLRPAFLNSVYYGSESNAQWYLNNTTIPTLINGAKTKIYIDSKEATVDFKPNFLSVSSFLPKEVIETTLNNL